MCVFSEFFFLFFFFVNEKPRTAAEETRLKQSVLLRAIRGEKSASCAANEITFCNFTPISARATALKGKNLLALSNFGNFNFKYKMANKYGTRGRERRVDACVCVAILKIATAIYPV